MSTITLNRNAEYVRIGSHPKPLYIIIEPRTANLLSPVCSANYDTMRSLAAVKGGVVSSVKFVEDKFGVKLNVSRVNNSASILR